ncbi:acyltransferase family protein [Pseudoleptotrichia goodfellowii]|uniref:acyltransferase family protein n=1 Tax=Pseudoleptotrichia goodfellowii TaxID=157692 RepID=UPI0004AFE767|nr:acyltransferase [Pseudoleptotrichia goodfellowii]
MKKNRRIEEIDVLRAAALIMICLYHWFTYKGMYVGVIIFFALSGYLFTSSLLSRDFSCFNVIKRRMSKIYPALLTVILVSTIVLIIMNGGLEEKYKNSAFFSVIGLNNIHQIISGISYFDSYNIILPLTHIWALSFQIQMYVFFPFILKGLKKFKLKDELIGIIFLE